MLLIFAIIVLVNFLSSTNAFGKYTILNRGIYFQNIIDKNCRSINNNHHVLNSIISNNKYSKINMISNSIISIDNKPNVIKKLSIDNFKLVPYFAKYYVKKYNLNYDCRQELIQEGYIGYMHACRKYDQTKGTKLSTYSYYWIKRYFDGYIKRYFKYQSLVNSNNKHYINNVYDKSYDNVKIDISNLNKYEKDLIFKKYYQKKKLKEIAKEYNISKSTLGTRYKNIILRLKKYNNIYLS